MSLTSLKSLQDVLEERRSGLIQTLLKLDSTEIGTFRFFQGQVEGVESALRDLEEIIKNYYEIEGS